MVGLLYSKNITLFNSLHYSLILASSNILFISSRFLAFLYILASSETEQKYSGMVQINSKTNGIIDFSDF